MLKTERQDEIVREVVRKGTASVAELAVRLGVSEITVRRDLDDLGAQGRLERIHGGARRIMPRDPEPPVLQREALQPSEKRAIAQVAVELVHDGDVVGIESGSTTVELARTIATRSWRWLQVVTNSFAVVNELIRSPGVRLIFVGGSVVSGELGAFGVLAEDALKRLSIDKLFITCRGLDPRVGVSNDLQAEATVGAERAFVAASRQVIVLADHTKFERVFLMQIVPIADIDVIVTDSLTPPEVLAEFSRQDAQVIVASPTGEALPDTALHGQKEEENGYIHNAATTPVS